VNSVVNLGLGELWAGVGSLSCEACFSRVWRQKTDSWSSAQTLPLCKNASAITESEISNQFMLAVFSKSVFLRMKVPFNKSEVIAL